MRIALIGATGMLGHKLWQRLPQHFPDTHAIIRRQRADAHSHGLFAGERVIEGIDALDFPALEGTLDRLRPDVIVNCVAITKRREAVAEQLPCIALNALLPHQLAAWAGLHTARLIHFSTDCVFDGKTGGYTEASLTNALDLYGRTKALGETTMPNALTLRSSFIGRELTNGTELLEWFIAQRGRRIRGYRQALYSGVSNLYLCDLVVDILLHHPALAGLYNLASEMISKYDLLCLAREKFGVDVEIEPDDGYECRRNLDGGRLQRALGTSPPSWAQMMAELAADRTPYEQWRMRDAA